MVAQRRHPIGVACSVSEKREIEAALKAAGHKTASQGGRVVLLAFARDIRVRYAVEAYEAHERGE